MWGNCSEPHGVTGHIPHPPTVHNPLIGKVALGNLTGMWTGLFFFPSTKHNVERAQRGGGCVHLLGQSWWEIALRGFILIFSAAGRIKKKKRFGRTWWHFQKCLRLRGMKRCRWNHKRHLSALFSLPFPRLPFCYPWQECRGEVSPPPTQIHFCWFQRGNLWPISHSERPSHHLSEHIKQWAVQSRLLQTGWFLTSLWMERIPHKDK